jgi:hypothetical protein
VNIEDSRRRSARVREFGEGDFMDLSLVAEQVGGIPAEPGDPGVFALALANRTAGVSHADTA